MNTRALTSSQPPSEALSLGDVLTADDAAALLGVSRWTASSTPPRIATRSHIAVSVAGCCSPAALS